MKKLKKLKPEKKKTGRPPGGGFHATQEQRDLVKQLVAYGIPHDDIARLIKNPSNNNQAITSRTLQEHFREEIDTGTTLAIAKVAGALFKNAVNDNNVTAQIFFLKTRARWKEPELEDVPPPMAGTIDMMALARQIALVLYLADKSKQGNTIELPHQKH